MAELVWELKFCVAMLLGGALTAAVEVLSRAGLFVLGMSKLAVVTFCLTTGLDNAVRLDGKADTELPTWTRELKKVCDKDTLAILVTVTVCVTNDSRVLLRIISVLLVTLGNSAVLVAVDCRMQRKKRDVG